MKSQTKQKYIMNHCWIFSISFLTTKTFYSKTQLNIQIKQKHFNRQTIFNRINEKKKRIRTIPTRPSKGYATFSS